MADNDKDVPIKEREDGSVLARVEEPEGFEDEQELKEGGKVDAADDNSDEEDHQYDQDKDSQEDQEDDDERERIREARREERRLKKELS